MNLTVPNGGPVKECKREAIGGLGQALLQLPGNFEIDVEHIVAEGLYGRLGFMPKGACVVSCIHLHEHITVALSGVCLVVDPDGVEELVTAPMVRVTPAGMQRAVYVLEDAVWFTVHRADVTDPETMREQLTVKTIEEFRAAVAALPSECDHEIDFVTDATKIAVQKISETRSERDLLHLLVDTLCDPVMNEIGGAFYSGEGIDMGGAARIALNRISRLPQEV